MTSSTAPYELSAQDMLEKFRSAVWGNSEIFKKCQSIDLGDHHHSIQYLDYGEHLDALEGICPVIRSQFMIVRDEYKDAMEALENDINYQYGAAILGQPGIGKTFFLVFALIERLRKQQPTAFQFWDDEYCLFTGEGVTVHSANKAWIKWKMPRNVWALSDSHGTKYEPAKAFKHPAVRVIHASSPDTKRWKDWTKQFGAGIYIMDVWMKEELAALASILSFNVHRMLNLATEWGPCPRTLLAMLTNKAVELQTQANINSLALDFVQNTGNYISSLEFLDLPLGKTGPSLIIFIRPHRDEHGQFQRSICKVYVPTVRIVHCIAQAVFKQDAHLRLQFFSATSTRASMRSAAGYVFEQWMHAHFLSKVHLSCRWLNDHSGLLPESLVTVQPSQLISTKHEIKAPTPFYWRPPTSNFPGIDGVLRLEDHAFAIQCTISSRHGSLLEGLRKVQNMMGSGVRWAVLFVGTNQSQAEEAARSWIYMPEAESSSRKGKKQKMEEKFIPIGVCDIPLVSEFDANVLPSLNQMEPITSAYLDDYKKGSDDDDDDDDLSD